MFLQIKDMKHFKWDFVLMPRSCPRVGLGAPGAPKGSNFYFFEHGHVAYQADGDCD